MKIIRNALYVGAIALLGLTACKKEDVEGEIKNAAMTVKMTDAPGDYAELNLEIERVDVYLENSGWITLSNESQMVNVLELTNGKSVTLANNSNVEAGLYTSVAIYFGDENSLTLNSGGGSTSFDLSGEGAVIIDINQEVDANSHAELLLDFNVMESIHSQGDGTIVLDPTIHHVDDPETGIQGHIMGGAFAAIEITDGENTFSTFTDANGNFILQGLEEGTYTVTVMLDAEGSGGSGSNEGGIHVGGLFGVIIDEDGIEAGDITNVTINNVGVVDGQITQLGSIEIG